MLRDEAHDRGLAVPDLRWASTDQLRVIMRSQAVPSSAMAKPWETATPQPFGAPQPGWQRAQQLPTTWDERPVQIAEITVDGPTVFTPHGDIARKDARWFLGGAVPAHASSPSWAIAAAILLAIPTCLVSLLLLLVKEDDMWASKLTVSGGGIAYSTTVYSCSTEEYEGIQAAIAWAQQVPEPPASTDRLALPS